MKLACLQTASLGWYACVAMETRCSWQQADYELLSAQGTYVPNMKLNQKSFKQQSLKCLKLTVSSKKETNGRVRMNQESRWAPVVEIGC